jgi:hypothetical protein
MGNFEFGVSWDNIRLNTLLIQWILALLLKVFLLVI